ncbi:MAG: 2-oxoacid:acceptor oxidoreductase subunit alpha [Bacillota bacterium]
MKLQELSWKVGGQQGEGIDTTGDILATALARQGYWLYGLRQFSSRIKGGYSEYKLRISVRPRPALSDDVHLILAINQGALEANKSELDAGCLVIADGDAGPCPQTGNILHLPMVGIAEELGNISVKNMVGVGAVSAILGLDPTPLHDIIGERFRKKGESAQEINIEAANRGYRWAQENYAQTGLTLERGDGQRRLYLGGNHALAMGAIAAGCRVMAAYPITPASEIMEYLVQKLPDIGGVMVQTEDEIAAITTAIGAGYAGARAMTATSGPGLSMMAEGLGLAGMAEIPVVVMDVQRGGPSTGLPTKHEQSNLLPAIFGSHGEGPRIVLAPGSIEDCFFYTVSAFNLAEIYQCPVIILSDVALSLAKQTADPFDLHAVELDRGSLLPVDQPVDNSEGLFKRYAFTASGISPRVIPGQPGGIHHVTGVEHDEKGFPAEDPLNRIHMMRKRLEKIPGKLPGSVSYKGGDDPYCLLVGFGSTQSILDETVELLAANGINAGRLQVKILWPFPVHEFAPYLDRAQRVFVVENNATGQLAELICAKTQRKDRLNSVLKFNGYPFTPGELYRRIKEEV